MRTVALAALVVLVLLSGGCMEAVNDIREGGGSLEFSAAPIHVEEETVSESEYELAADTEVSFEQSVSVQDQSREVDVGAHMVHLTRTHQGTVGNVVLLSIPQIELLGQQIDMVERVGPDSLIEEAQGSTDDLERSQKIEDRSADILGQSRTVEVFSGSATTEGETAQAKIYVVTFDHEGDTILGVAVSPQVGDTTDASVIELFESVQYG